MATPVARSSRWPTIWWWRFLLRCCTESSTTTIPTMRSLGTLYGVARMSWAPGEKMAHTFSDAASKDASVIDFCLTLFKGWWVTGVLLFSKKMCGFFSVCYYLINSYCWYIGEISLFIISTVSLRFLVQQQTKMTELQLFLLASSASPHHYLRHPKAGAPLHNTQAHTLPKVLLLEWKRARSPLTLRGYSRSSHHHDDAKTVFDSQAKQ